MEDRFVRDQQIPVVVADLVAEVAEKRSIGLLHGGTTALALRIVSLLQRERDGAALVPGHHRLSRRFFGEKLEAQAMADVLVPRRERQAQTQQRIEQALLGALDHLPMVEIGTVVHRRDDAVVAASATERVAAWIVFHKPVAGAPLGVDALDELFAGESRRPQGVTFGLERDDHVRRVPIAEGVPAAFADRVLEIEEIAAMIAAEELQVPPFSTTLPRVEGMDKPCVPGATGAETTTSREVTLKQGDGADTRHKCRCGEKIVFPPAPRR